MQRLIDANALKKSIEELKRSPWFNSVLNLSWHAGIKEAVEVVERLCIDKAPTIDAVPVRHGKWIHRGCGIFACSKCGKDVGLNVYTGEKASERFRFCPNCGARMDEE